MDKKTKKQEKAEKKRLDKERKKVMQANGQRSSSSLSRFNPLKSSKKFLLLGEIPFSCISLAF